MPIDEEVLRARLDRTLGRVTAGPPPVAAVLRRGRQMRIGIRVAAAALVVVVGGATAVAVVGLEQVHGRQVPPAAPKRTHSVHWPTERIVRLAARARNGLFAMGVEHGGGWDGTWRMWVDRRTGRVYDGLVGYRRWTAGRLGKSVLAGRIATFYGASIEAWPGTYAVVAPNVTKIVDTLSDGQKLDLYPVEVAGRRWVGLLTPLDVGVVTETAYSGRTVIGHMVTHGGQPVTWLSPGDPGLAVRQIRVGSGRVPMHSRWRWSLWSAVVNAGPWGYCISLSGFQSLGLEDECLSPAQARLPGVHAVTSTRPKWLAHWLVGTVRPSVGYLTLRVADGSTIKAPVVTVDGVGFYALAIVQGQVIVSWGAYDAAGQRLYGGSGAPRLAR